MIHKLFYFLIFLKFFPNMSDSHVSLFHLCEFLLSNLILLILQAADVQAELQQYLNSKNINSLFISIVENLLIEKPANPIAFMIEYLYKQYPDQAKIALETLNPNSSNSE